jgi:hypothetical protein
MITDIFITFLILLSFTLAVNVKANLTNKKNKNEEKITDNDLTILSKCDKIFWANLSSNIYAIELLNKRFTYEKELSHEEYNRLPFNHKIDWPSLSGNENAIELIKKRIEYENYLGNEYKYQEVPYTKNTLNKINWNSMTINQNAIELLRERIKYEKSLNSDEYARLQDKIQLVNCLHSNKNIMILMKDYYLSNK